MKRLKGLIGSLAVVSGVILGSPARGLGQETPEGVSGPAPMPGTPPVPTTTLDVPGSGVATGPASTTGLLNANSSPIDLNMALRLAGVQNPELLVARQRVLEAVALRQFAAAQLLPTINGGGNYDTHTGVLQQSNGNMLSVNRSALYVGAGSNAVAAGTVNIPGLVMTGNIATGIYAWLTARQVVQQREFATIAVRNQVFLEVTLAYSELIRAEGRLSIAQQNREEAAEIARLTANYAESGEGRLADANRAAAELAIREADLQAAEGTVITASARLAQAINVDPSVRLHPTDAWAVPQPVVPDPIPIPQLIAIALMQRPELAERRAAIRAALLSLSGAKVLPFSPNYILGFSAGGFGGGSNLVRPIFGGFGSRTDFDAVTYWSILNMGVGNAALINQAKAQLQITRYEQLSVLNRIRAEVAQAYALTHARFAQIGTTEQAVRAGKGAFERDLARIKERAAQQGREILPIELINSFRLLARSREAYLDAIVEYNEAHFSLYVALGQPPANVLARPVPTEGVEPTQTTSQPAPEAPTAPIPPTQPGPFQAPPVAMTPRPGAPQPAAAVAPNVGPQTPAPADEVQRVVLPR